MAGSATTARTNQGAATGHSSKFRLDIQGLRAVAVGVVLLYHAGMPWLPGGFVGVDVFFVISGFLITGGMVRELRNEGRLSLKGFYARRAARILPAATVALFGVLVLTWLILPMTRWAQVSRDAAASGVYVVNWLFADSAVDYLARDAAPSPFQHFWSLAVEEQFYLVWPLLLAAAGGLAYKMGKDRKLALILAFSLIAVPSFVWSIHMTEANPGGAYFATTTRVWELAIGAGLAITAGSVHRVPKLVASVVGWLGLAAITASAVLYTPALPFPSYTALLPTLGAAAVIWAGPGAGAHGPIALLQLPPMVKIGEVSYSLYLWHWPLIVLAGAVFGPLTPEFGLLVVALSFFPAWLSLKFVERPTLKWSKAQFDHKPALQMGGLVTLSAVTAAILLSVMVPPVPPAPTIDVSAIRSETTTGKVELLGAEVLFADPTQTTAVDSFKSLTPGVLSITEDVPLVNKNGCMQSDNSVEAVKCSFGDIRSDKVIAVVGDSHAAMLIPGFSALGQAQGWRVDTYTKGSCPFVTNTVALAGRPYDSCRQWADNVTQALLAENPKVVVSAMSNRYRVMQGAALGLEQSVGPLAEGLREAWKPFLAQGIPVVAVKDAPRPDVQVADCIAKNEQNLTQCAWPKQSILAQNPPEPLAVEGLANASVMDLTPALCPQDICPAVIGGAVVYRDGNHLTATYAQTLHSHMGASLASIVK